MSKLRVYIVDDEHLAVKRLSRLLRESGKVEIVGEATDPRKALNEIPGQSIDAVFLDIEMPELNGFELLQKLVHHPPIVFTTAYDEYALRAFDVFSIDYLLKPVESERLAKTLTKLEQLSITNVSLATLKKVVDQIAHQRSSNPKELRRIASRTGGRIHLISVGEITHFFSEDKVTFAQDVEGKNHPVDHSLTDLETRLGQEYFRIHRRAIVNINFIDEVFGWFSGSILVRLNTNRRVELAVARNRVSQLKSRLGI